MPTKLKHTDVDLNSANIVNAILNDARPDSALGEVTARVGVDGATMRDIGQPILSYTPRANQFIETLINRIGRVVMTNKFYLDAWEHFEKGLLDYGETVQELFVELAKPFNYNPKGEGELNNRRANPSVPAAYHTLNYQKIYEQTISEDELRLAFLSSEGVSALILKVTETLVSAANWDSKLVKKYMLCRNWIDGNISTTVIPAPTKTTSDDIVIDMRRTSNDFTENDTQFNEAGVVTKSSRLEQNIILDHETDAVVSVGTLAKAFHIEEAQLMGKFNLVNRFNMTDAENARLALLFEGEEGYVPITAEENLLLEKLHAVLLDDNWYQVYTKLYKTNEVYVAVDLYWNYFLHLWKIFSHSPYSNIHAFAEQEPPAPAPEP